VHELRALVDAYALAVDERDATALTALFADDGILAVVGPDGVEAHRYVGRGEISAVPARLERYDSTLHLVSTHLATCKGDAGTGVAYCEAHHRTGGADAVRFIRYDDEYVRSGDGWHFACRSVRTLWIEER
jgi:hypothetical protein